MMDVLASSVHGALYGGPYGVVALAIVVSGLVLLGAQRALTVPRATLIRRRVQSQMTAAERAQRRQAAPGLTELLGLARVWLERRLGETKSWSRVALIVERAGWRIHPADAILIATAGGLVLATIAVVAGATPLLAFLALMLGVWAPFAFAVMKGRKRDHAFDDQLPDVLLALSSSLKVGHSFDHSLQNVAEDGRPPASEEFARVLQELRLGRPVEAALADLGKRVRSEHLAFVRTAVTIQREVGGSLAGLFETVAETVRERQQLARKLRSLTAMGRMSAAVLVCLPFVAVIGLSATSPGYMRPLYETSAGRTMIVAGFVMILIGGLILKRIVSPPR
jgi:tight adherence protein B